MDRLRDSNLSPPYMLPKRIKLHRVRCQSGHDVRWNRRSYTVPVNGQINNDMSYKTTTEHKDRKLPINVQSTCYLILQQLSEITKKKYGKRNESSWGESQPGLPPKTTRSSSRMQLTSCCRTNQSSSWYRSCSYLRSRFQICSHPSRQTLAS